MFLYSSFSALALANICAYFDPPPYVSSGVKAALVFKGVVGGSGSMLPGSSGLGGDGDIAAGTGGTGAAEGEAAWPPFGPFKSSSMITSLASRNSSEASNALGFFTKKLHHVCI